MIVEQGAEATGAETTQTANTSAQDSPIVTDQSIDTEIHTSANEGDPSKEAPPPYNPNFKFTAAQKEHEFDDLFKPLVKSKEVEEKIRELYTKGYGIESLREDRDSLKTRFSEMNETLTQQGAIISAAQEFIQRKDYASLLEHLNVPVQDIMQFAHMQLKLQSATPEQKQAYENSRRASQDAVRLTQENQTMQQRLAEMAQAQTARDLDMLTQRPDVSVVMQAFDARMGKVGSFRDKVYERGQYHYMMSGKDVPVEQAVNEVLALIGPLPQGQVTPPNLGAASHGAPAKKSVIPNIQGRGTSPAKKVISSLDDLKKRRQELEARGG